jgi:hypothetical protein
VIAKALGYKTVLHYSSMDWHYPNGVKGTDRSDSFYITLGGIILIDTISILSLLLLLFSRGQAPRYIYWALVFFSMLIYRHIMLTFICLIITIVYGKKMSFGADETEIANFLSLPNYVIGIPLLIIALLSAYLLYFNVLGSKMRLTFFYATVIGGIIGYIVWLYILGPVVMP